MMFANILMFSLLYALGDHRTPLIAIVGALSIEIVLNLWWLPHHGIVAAGWARLAAEIFNGSTMAWGLLRRGLLSWTILVGRPLCLLASTLGLLALLRQQPVVFQFSLAWLGFIIVGFFLGLGRERREEVAAIS